MINSDVAIEEYFTEVTFKLSLDEYCIFREGQRENYIHRWIEKRESGKLYEQEE